LQLAKFKLYLPIKFATFTCIARVKDRSGIPEVKRRDRANSLTQRGTPTKT
jgi:hypothetical protein